MHNWKRVSRPPIWAIDKDVNQQWKYQIMTEVYGLCGIGWKWNIKRLWTEYMKENQRVAIAEVEVNILQDGIWSSPIQGVGVSMFVDGESSDHEAFKKATTDALSEALRMIGVASDIYAGHWDGSKYTRPNELDSDPVSALTKKAILSVLKSHVFSDEEREKMATFLNSPKATELAAKTKLEKIREAEKSRKVAESDTIRLVWKCPKCGKEGQTREDKETWKHGRCEKQCGCGFKMNQLEHTKSGGNNGRS